MPAESHRFVLLLFIYTDAGTSGETHREANANVLEKLESEPV